MSEIRGKIPVLVVAAILLIGGAGAAWWWLWPVVASTQIATDPCVLTAHTFDYDFTEEEYRIGEGWFLKTEGEHSANGEKATLFARTGDHRMERIRIYSTPQTIPRSDEGNQPRASVRPSIAPLRFAEYSRVIVPGEGVSEWRAWNETEDKIRNAEGFCFHAAGLYSSVQRTGTATINGISTTKYTGVPNVGDNPPQADFQYEVDYYVDGQGRLVRFTHRFVNSGWLLRNTYSNWGEANIITAPDDAYWGSGSVSMLPFPSDTGGSNPSGVNPPPANPDPGPGTTEPTTEPTAEPTEAPTEEPTIEPEPIQSAWLEPDPSDMTIGDDWETFTLRGTGVERLQVQYNYRNASGSTSSTGAVAMETSTAKSQDTACEISGFGGRDRSVGNTFHFIGCSDGVTIIRLLYGQEVLRIYNVRVNVN